MGIKVIIVGGVAIGEIPTDSLIVTVCGSGIRGYEAAYMLQGKIYVKWLSSGGYFSCECLF